jgi:ribokinase
LTILVVGAIHHDVIVDAPSLPRLDETLPGSAVRYAFGGKGGNQAVAAGRLTKHDKISVAMAACVGSDTPGDQALDILADAGVATNQVQRVETPTGMSVAISLPDGGYGAVIVSGSNQKLDVDAIAIAPPTQWVVLQNELPLAANETIAEKAKRAGARVLLNAAPARPLDSDLAGQLDCLVVNRVEAADLLGLSAKTLDGKAAVLQLAANYGCAVIVTLGDQGLWFIDLDSAEFLPAHEVSVISSHGAGDAFIGALTVALCRGQSLAAGVRYASAAAAMHVSTPIEERTLITDEMVQTLAQTSSR